MSTATRQVLQTSGSGLREVRPAVDEKNGGGEVPELPRQNGSGARTERVRIFIVAENRLLQEALSRMISRRGEAEVVGKVGGGIFQPSAIAEERADLLLLTSRGSLTEDVQLIRKVRAAAPQARIVLIGGSGEEGEFLQCVRAGVRGYLLREASADDVWEAVRGVHAGSAVCPGSLCLALFRYFEREATSLPSARVHEQLGLTRREQQLIPLIAEGLTNKEIANHFCLSEQTVKNHLYRMKQKVGAGDRLGIVQTCRTQGFMI